MQNVTFDYSLYRKKIHSNKTTIFPLLFVAIILLMGVAVFISQPRKNLTKFYFVETDEFLVYSTAQASAETLQKQGGAGYIHFDKTYHLLAGFYPEYDKAKTVCENIKADYPNAKVFTLEIEQFVPQKTQKEIEKIIKNTSEYTKDLYEILISQQSNTISNEKASLTLQEITKKIQNECDDFISHYNSTQKLSKATHYANEMKQNASTITTSNLKTALIKQVITYSYFLSSF